MAPREARLKDALTARANNTININSHGRGKFIVGLRFILVPELSADWDVVIDTPEGVSLILIAIL